MLSHTSVTAKPILGRIVNPTRIGRILDQTGINIREEDCASCAGNLDIKRPLVQLRGHQDRMRHPVQGHSAFLIKDELCNHSLRTVGGGCALGKDNLPLMKGWKGDREVTVLRYTGSTGGVVKAELVNPSQFTGRN